MMSAWQWDSILRHDFGVDEVWEYEIPAEALADGAVSRRELRKAVGSFQSSTVWKTLAASSRGCSQNLASGLELTRWSTVLVAEKKETMIPMNGEQGDQQKSEEKESFLQLNGEQGGM